jgi:hypothetical protein
MEIMFGSKGGIKRQRGYLMKKALDGKTTRARWHVILGEADQEKKRTEHRARASSMYSAPLR